MSRTVRLSPPIAYVISSPSSSPIAARSSSSSEICGTSAPSPHHSPETSSLSRGSSADHVRLVSSSSSSRPRSVSRRVVVDRNAVDVADPRPHERREQRLGDAGRDERGADRLALRGLNINEKVIRRARRQRRLPLRHQLRAHRRQQQQHHETDAERDHLHAALAAAPGDVRDTVTPGDADAATKPLQRQHEQPPGKVQHEERGDRARQQVSDELEVAEQHVEQRR